MLTQVLATVEASVVLHTSYYQRYIEAVSAVDPLTPLLQYGVLGLVVLGFATGWIVPGPTAKAYAAENARLSALIEGKLLPMSEQYAATMERAAIALEKSSEALDRLAERDRLEAERNRLRSGR